MLRVPDEPVPDDAAGLRAANARLRELLTAVTETGTNSDVTWAGQAIDALLALKKAADAARAEGADALSAGIATSTPAGSGRPPPPERP